MHLYAFKGNIKLLSCFWKFWLYYWYTIRTSFWELRPNPSPEPLQISVDFPHAFSMTRRPGTLSNSCQPIETIFISRNEFFTKIFEHFGKDKELDIYQHLMSSTDYLEKCSEECLSILDTANTKHQFLTTKLLCISHSEDQFK